MIVSRAIHRAAAWRSTFSPALSGLVLCLILVPLPARAQPHTCGPGTVPEFGRWFSPDMDALTSTHLTDTVEPKDPGSGISAMRLLIEIAPGTTKEWNVVIRDSDFRGLVTMGPHDFPAGGPSSRWTGVVKTNRVILDLVAPTGSDIRVTAADGIAYPANSTGRLFSIVNPAHPWQELYVENGVTLPKRAGDVVGMLVGAYKTPSVRGSWCCSGVMISADVMLTNWHCGGSPDLKMKDEDYWSGQVCTNTVVDLGWAKGAPGRKYRCETVLESNKPLDFALLRLGNVLGPETAAGEPNHARMSVNRLHKGDNIFVVHHSQCMEKLVSGNCQVQSTSFPGWLEPPAPPGSTGPDFSHNCNTESGASGSPIFDESGLVIGLHHVGAGAHEGTCKVSNGENKAVRITEIMHFLRATKPALADELGIPQEVPVDAPK
jgi:trypsin-like peptidase